MKSFGKISLILILLAFAAGLAWEFSKGEAGKGSGKKRYGKVQRGDLIQRVTVSGQVVPLRRTIFIPPFSGYISKMYVSTGQKVKRGDPIVAIASSLLTTEQVFPIRAPFAGIVVDVKKMEGEYVTEKEKNDIMVRLDDQSKFFVSAKAAELDAARIKRGMEVEVRVNAIRSGVIKGVVRNIDLAAQEADGWKSQQSTFDVRVEILDPPDDLRSGQSALIDIVTDRFNDVLFLEHEYINKKGDTYFVITKSGTRKDIEVGRQSDLAVEIVKGLDVGEEVEQIDFLELLESGS